MRFNVSSILLFHFIYSCVTFSSPIFREYFLCFLILIRKSAARSFQKRLFNGALSVAAMCQQSRLFVPPIRELKRSLTPNWPYLDCRRLFSLHVTRGRTDDES